MIMGPRPTQRKRANSEPMHTSSKNVRPRSASGQLKIGGKTREVSIDLARARTIPHPASIVTSDSSHFLNGETNTQVPDNNNAKPALKPNYTGGKPRSLLKEVLIGASVGAAVGLGAGELVGGVVGTFTLPVVGSVVGWAAGGIIGIIGGAIVGSIVGVIRHFNNHRNTARREQHFNTAIKAVNHYQDSSKFNYFNERTIQNLNSFTDKQWKQLLHVSAYRTPDRYEREHIRNGVVETALLTGDFDKAMAAKKLNANARSAILHNAYLDAMMEEGVIYEYPEDSSMVTKITAGIKSLGKFNTKGNRLYQSPKHDALDAELPVSNQFMLDVERNTVMLIDQHDQKINLNEKAKKMAAAKSLNVPLDVTRDYDPRTLLFEFCESDKTATQTLSALLHQGIMADLEVTIQQDGFDVAGFENAGSNKDGGPLLVAVANSEKVEMSVRKEYSNDGKPTIFIEAKVTANLSEIGSPFKDSTQFNDSRRSVAEGTAKMTKLMVLEIKLDDLKAGNLNFKYSIRPSLYLNFNIQEINNDN